MSSPSTRRRARPVTGDARSCAARVRDRLPDARQRRRGGGRRAGGAAAPARAPTASRTPQAFLTTVTTRLAIDVLRSARVRRETYVGAWLPEPLVEDDAARRPSRTRSRSRSPSSSLLERLSPVERAVLRAARVVRLRVRRDRRDRRAISEANCRQILTRARRRVDDERPRFDADPRERARARRRASSPPPATATSTGSSRCSRPTPSWSATAAARPARSRARCVGAAAGRPRARARSTAAVERVGRRRSSRRSSTASPASAPLDADGRLVNVVGVDVAGGVVPAHPLDAQPGQARPPRPAVRPRAAPLYALSGQTRSGTAPGAATCSRSRIPAASNAATRPSSGAEKCSQPSWWTGTTHARPEDLRGLGGLAVAQRRAGPRRSGPRGTRRRRTGSRRRRDPAGPRCAAPRRATRCRR